MRVLLFTWMLVSKANASVFKLRSSMNSSEREEELEWRT